MNKEKLKEFRGDIVKNMTDGYILTDLEGKIIDVNNAYCKMSGYSKEDLEQMHITDIDIKFTKRAIQKVLRDFSKSKILETCHKGKNGETYIMEVAINKVIKDGDIYFNAILRDITSRKKLEQKAKELSEKTKLITENLDEVVWLRSKNHSKIQYISSSYEKIWGRSCESLYSNPDSFIDSVYDEDKDRVLEALEEYKSTGEFEIEYRIVRKDKSIRWIKARSFPVRDKKGNIIKHVGRAVDVTRRKKLEKELSESIERFELAVEGSNAGIWDWDIKDDDVFFSKRWKEILGYKDSELKSRYKTFENLVYGEDLERINKHIEDYFNGNIKEFNIEFRMKHKDGSIRWILAQAKGVRDNEGNIVRLAGSHLDITQRKKNEQRLKYLKEKAEKANKAKSEFLSNMTHEIRTPLTAIVGFSDVLRDEETGSEIKEMIEDIYDSGQNLLDLINDILDIAKIESGQTAISNEKIDLKELFEKINSIYNGRTAKKGLKYKSDYDNDIPNIIMGDSLKIKKILHNLLGNAVKFTSSGYIETRVNLVQQTQEKVIIQFEIEDTGIGINKEKQESLFKKFDQGEYFLTKKYGGTGLGLALVNELLNLLNGEIKVKTEIGKGTTFFVTIPFKSPKLKEDKNTDEREEKKVGGVFIDAKVILAEDSVINQKLIIRILQDRVKKLEIVENGEKLLKKIKEENYDLILMDVQMPKMNGFEVTKILKGQEKYKDIPIIGLSAFALKGSVKKALEFGMDDYVKKPIDKKELVEKINKWTKK